MKKALLGSTAFLGAALIFTGPAAAEFETTLSGFLKAEFWAVDQDDTTDDRDYVFGVDDSEFVVKARNTADNGLTYGVNLEFELSGAVSMDEGYLFFEGEWGTLQLGGNDGVSNDIPYSGDFSLTAAFGYDGGLSSVYNFAAGGVDAPDLAADTGDAAKINYYSPRFNGFQFGITYLPDSGQATIGSDSLSSPAVAPFDGDDEDVIQVGANFVDTINGFDIGVGIAYSTSDPDTATVEDTEGVHVGFNVGTQGFSFGASYGDNFDSGCLSATSGCDGGQFYEVAGAYSTGPVTVSAGYFRGEKDDSATSDHETDIFSLGAKYALAPGAVIIVEYDHVNEDGPPDNEGDVFMVGTQISF